MNNRPLLLALRTIVFLALFIAPAAFSQMPAKPGKLVIKSDPPGAKIVINGTTLSEAAPATIVVSPGTYKVMIGTCAEQTIPVASGDTKEVHCP
jgi:D-alanyl-D-alanine carboxypeptidase